MGVSPGVDAIRLRKGGPYSSPRPQSSEIRQHGGSERSRLVDQPLRNWSRRSDATGMDTYQFVTYTLKNFRLIIA